MYGGVTLENSSIIRVCRDGMSRGELVGVSDHAEERVGFGNAVDRPGGVELFMTAVLGVDLREHKELNVVGVARAGSSGGECVKEVRDFGGVEGKTE